MKTWVKLYTEINRDPDMGTLSWEQRGIWSALLALCGELDNRDEDENETGEITTTSKIAWHIRIDLPILEAAISAFEDREMVHILDGIVYLTHYGNRQQRPPSARPSAVSARVRQHRESARECNEDVTSVKQGVTPSDKSRVDTDEKREEETAIVDDLVSQVFQSWSDINPRRQITPLDADMLNDMITEHGASEVADAIVKANAQGVPKLAYIEGILKRNGEDTRPPSKRNGGGKLQGIGANMERMG